MPRKMIGTLTLSIPKSVHALISPIFLHESCSVATPEHSEPLPLGNRVHIVALAPDLRRVSFYSATDFLYHSSTIDLLLSLILIKGSYPSSKASPPCERSPLALWLLRCVNSCMVAMQISGRRDRAPRRKQISYRKTIPPTDTMTSLPRFILISRHLYSESEPSERLCQLVSLTG